VDLARFDYRIRLWDVAGLRELARSEDFTQPPATVAFTPDGNSLLCGGDQVVHLLAIRPRWPAVGAGSQAGRDGTRLTQVAARGTALHRGFSPD
jgi:hypothetical protein